MPKDKSDLEGLKKNYAKIEKEFNLPSFKELNEDFHIERVAEIETDYLIREVRKFIADKLSNYLRFIEAMLNPVNAPMFIFSMVKSMEVGDREKLKSIYRNLAKIEVNLIVADIEFSEKKEAEFINNSYKVWQSVKRDFLEIFYSVNKNWDINKIDGNNKSYFG